MFLTFCFTIQFFIATTLISQGFTLVNCFHRSNDVVFDLKLYNSKSQSDHLSMSYSFNTIILKICLEKFSSSFYFHCVCVNYLYLYCIFVHQWVAKNSYWVKINQFGGCPWSILRIKIIGYILYFLMKGVMYLKGAKLNEKNTDCKCKLN